MTVALAVEWMKFRRSIVARLATGLAVFAPPVFALGAVGMARSATLDGPNAERFAVYQEGTVNEAQMLAAAQILCVVMLIASGFVASWMFGREYADRSIGSLYGLPVTLRITAAAKLTIAVAWVVACVTAAGTLVVAGSVLTEPGGINAEVWRQVATLMAAAVLMGLLGLPFAWVAVVTRGYLGAVGAVIGATAVSQILASLGVGRWVPYVAPALWAGAGGSEPALAISPVHLLWSLVAAAVGAAAAVRATDRPLH